MRRILRPKPRPSTGLGLLSAPSTPEASALVLALHQRIAATNEQVMA